MFRVCVGVGVSCNPSPENPKEPSPDFDQVYGRLVEAHFKASFGSFWL